MIQNETIAEVEGKIHKVITLLDATRQEKDKCVSEIDRLEEKVASLEGEKDELGQKYETLKMAKSLAGENAGSNDAKLKINNIVRELDRCIALLNQ